MICSRGRGIRGFGRCSAALLFPPLLPPHEVCFENSSASYHLTFLLSQFFGLNLLEADLETSMAARIQYLLPQVFQDSLS